MADLIRNPHEVIQPDFAPDNHTHNSSSSSREQAVVTTNARDRAESDRVQEQRVLAQHKEGCKVANCMGETYLLRKGAPQ